MYGKSIRLARLMHQKSSTLCMVPMDHGTTLGPVEGVREGISTIRKVVEGGADALCFHKGLLAAVSKCPDLSSMGRYFMHISVSTVQNSDPTDKVLVGTVQEAVKMGADGVSVHINFGVPNESQMIRDLGMVSKECMEWGMPFLAMVYSHKLPKNVFDTAHAARLAEELGADIVKIAGLDSIQDIEKVVRGVSVPIIVSGGEKVDEPMKLLQKINNAMLAGASGVAIGRNVFQSKNPRLMTSIISKMVHGELKLQDCLYELKETGDAV